MSELEKICPHFHLSLTKRMRCHTRADEPQIYNRRIRKSDVDICVKYFRAAGNYNRCDRRISGETEEEFAVTKEVFRKNTFL